MQTFDVTFRAKCDSLCSAGCELLFYCHVLTAFLSNKDVDSQFLWDCKD